MQFRLDQLGKNILRDFFVLVGSAETEVEVPPGDAQRIDLWHVPDPDLLRAHAEIEPGLLRSMAAEAGMVEVFSDAPDLAAFHACVRKRYQWHHLLELRAERSLPLPPVWLLCAGRPDGVLEEFGFVPDASGPEGVYVTKPAAWRVHVVAIGELPRTRSTILLRLLGSPRVRRGAQLDLAALPANAWEVRVALPWLVRLSFELPAEVVQGLSAEERDWVMETREWFEEWRRKNVEEPIQQAKDEAHLGMMVELFEMRLGRPLTEAEHATIAGRLRALGRDRLSKLVLGSSADAAAAWLADPNAR
ncbi:MAG: hypothetical protein QM820_56345 [Minicystis sp.]